MALWLPDEADNLRSRPEYAVAFSYGVKHVLVGGRLLFLGESTRTLQGQVCRAKIGWGGVL